MKSITYVYSGGRSENYFKDNVLAKDFYYGITEFDKEKYKINIIEFQKKSGFFNVFLKFFDKLMTRFVSLPFYTSLIVNVKNLKLLLKTNYLILVNENVGCSMLPLLILLKFKKDLNVSMFSMGLYSKKLRIPFLKPIHNFFIKLLVKNINQVLFLGKGEYNKAMNTHQKLYNKFFYFPFSIDTKFWGEDVVSSNEKNGVVFVGNDGNRDSELLINIVKKLSNISFTLITSIPELVSLNLPNVKVFEGKWGNSNISDAEIKRFYQDSRLSIIPLKESTQPSGQSVALQSMCAGVPVIISRTEGFWDDDKFENNENIIFPEKNTLEAWVGIIEKYYNDNRSLEKVALNASKNVNDNFNLTIFTKALQNIIGFSK